MTKDTLKNKKFFLDQHGCAKNQVDGELIVTRLLNLGLVKTERADDADLIIVNSCGFIESAKTESLNAVIDARQDYPKAKILLAGCLAQRYAKEFESDLQEADGIFGNGDLSQVDGVVEDLLAGKRPVLTPPQKGVCCGDRNLLLNFKNSAYVKITEGCNNCCSFCAIPLIRGPLRSRKALDIVSEIRDLVSKGCFEINLIGQDLAAYGCGKEDKDETLLCDSQSSQLSPLARLIRMISSIEGDFAVRLLYIHPDHFNADILAEMKKDARFLHYFDIPFQSGDESIIKAMNRKGNPEEYLNLIKSIRKVFPDAAIRTTFMAGFPGESDDATNNTLDFLKKVQAQWSGCFTYSKEEGTVAYKMKGTVGKRLAEKRAKLLQDAQSQLTSELLLQRLQQTYRVLIEEVVEDKSGQGEGLAIGRAWFQAPEVDGAFVVRYDADDKDAVKQIHAGALVLARAESLSGVDIDGVWLAGQ